MQAAADTPMGEDLRLRVAGINDLGDPIEFVALLPISEGTAGEERLEAAGVITRVEDDKMFIDDVLYGSAAQAAGLDWDQEVLRVLKPVATPSKYWMFIPALLLLALVVVLQRGRTARAARKEAVV